MAQQVQPDHLGMVSPGGEPSSGSASLPPNGVPDWSGRIEFLDDDRTAVLVRMHVSDIRAISIDGYEHVDYYEHIEGDCEYHIFRRRDL